MHELEDSSLVLTKSESGFVSYAALLKQEGNLVSALEISGCQLLSAAWSVKLIASLKLWLPPPMGTASSQISWSYPQVELALPLVVSPLAE